LLAKIGVDTAENEPLKVHLIIQPWDFIFTEPPRPAEKTQASHARSWHARLHRLAQNAAVFSAQLAPFAKNTDPDNSDNIADYFPRMWGDLDVFHAFAPLSPQKCTNISSNIFSPEDVVKMQSNE